MFFWISHYLCVLVGSYVGSISVLFSHCLLNRFWVDLGVDFGTILGGFGGSKSVIFGIDLLFFACRSKSGLRAPKMSKTVPRALKEPRTPHKPLEAPTKPTKLLQGSKRPPREFQEAPEPIWQPCWCHVGAILEPYWSNVATILVTFPQYRLLRQGPSIQGPRPGGMRVSD